LVPAVPAVPAVLGDSGHSSIEHPVERNGLVHHLDETGAALPAAVAWHVADAGRARDARVPHSGMSAKSAGIARAQFAVFPFVFGSLTHSRTTWLPITGV